MKSFLLIKKVRLIRENIASKFDNINNRCINEGGKKIITKISAVKFYSE